MAAHKKPEESTSDSSGPMTFAQSFKTYASFGEKDRSAHDTITLKNIDKWIKQAGISVTPADTAITFSKIAKKEKRISIGGMENFLIDLARQKGQDVEKYKAKLLSVAIPRSSATSTAIGGSAAQITSRLTDTSGYTGMHKGKFDASGKGIPLSERDDVVSSDGYVQGYHSKDSYEKKK